ncbi:PREDICTED: uncharacterized protein LOC106812887 [Priapulus caudatus]|uniref:Uncharacterized protein LOC106812887 n=1 Tax=Priapulus caudatus TaxID=37621 RepID=A0ABM1EJK1_PRICU|nr:PREDICTED: uncharacterized protein LOC106812887 [Priapulus caudatus]
MAATNSILIFGLALVKISVPDDNVVIIVISVRNSYFHGANAEGETVHFGLPLLVQVHSDKDVIKAAIAGRNFVKLRDFSIGAFLPKSHHGNAPEPTDASVKLDHIPAQRFFVKDFGGAGIGIRKLAHAKYLADKLKANEEVFDHDWFYIARYSRPMHRYRRRRNEIWFFAAKLGLPAYVPADVD